jgi:asparagine synthase (glutamine-hydrolysing)
VRGATPAQVRTALDTRDPLSGTFGYAGVLPDGTAIRDVLGRHPLFYDARGEGYAFDHTDLPNARSLPAGHVRTASEPPRRAFSLPVLDPLGDEAVAVDAVQAGIETAFDELASSAGDASAGDAGDGPIAVAFSGGVDSALVAAHLDAPCHVVGYEGSADIQAARASADAMGCDLTVHEVSVPEIEAAIPAVATAIGRTNAMDVQIALPLYLAAERIAAAGFDRVALGQGADELFGGYAKIANAPDDDRVDADTVRGARREVLETVPDQLERDVLAIRAAGLEPVTPLLHDAIVSAALRLPGSLLVDDDVRKVALRRVAADVLPDEVAMREKKAIQYGSLVAREVDRLARQAGFKRRMADHVQRYIESRL